MTRRQSGQRGESSQSHALSLSLPAGKALMEACFALGTTKILLVHALSVLGLLPVNLEVLLLVMLVETLLLLVLTITVKIEPTVLLLPVVIIIFALASLVPVPSAVSVSATACFRISASAYLPTSTLA